MSLSDKAYAERERATSKDAYEEMVTMFDVQEYLLLAPKCIAILEELMLISTAADFTLEKKPLIGGFKHIRWPNSFKGSLVQVSNAGWKAFNEAHKSMDKIRLHTAYVPGHLKEAVTILMKGAVDEVRDILPILMAAVKNTAKQCQELVIFAEEKFQFVMELTTELLEACITANEGYKNELKEIKIAFVKRVSVIGEIRQQLSNLVEFFQTMSRIIECDLIDSLEKFINLCMKVQNFRLDAYPISGLQKHFMYKLAFEACKTGYLVNIISGTYVEVSNAYIMEPIAGLGKLLALDPENEKHEIHRQKEALFRRCEGSQNEIKALIEKKKREFNQQIDSRMQKVINTLEAALSPTKEEELEKSKSVKESLEKKLKDIPSKETSFDEEDFL